MKLQFKHQRFQTEAVAAVCNCFEGQINNANRFLVDTGSDSGRLKGEGFDTIGWKNAEINISEDALLQNIRQVQKQLNILPQQQIERLNNKPCFTVEMETGTGKTYTYIKTMYELNIKYGWSKFIIVVPSIAIREGVYKSFQITAEHFKEDYGKQCRFFIYNSSRLNELEQYATDPNINVMIINTQAFNSRGEDARRIDMKLDSFQSRKPIDVIAAVNPIVIIDEPQSVIGTDRAANVTRQSVQKFNPLFYINYSATHRENFNMVYRLDAVDAYQKQLVKKISVKGISVKGTTATTAFLYLQKINVYPGKRPDCVLQFDYIGNTSLTKKTLKCGQGDNIYALSGEIEAYRNGYTISNINANTGTIEFTGGLILSEGEIVGAGSENDMRRVQIRETILSHIEKERTLFRKNIKTLSLFFIDEVEKYRTSNCDDAEKSFYAETFEEEYKEAVEKLLAELPFDEEMEYRAFLEQYKATPSKVHAGYFSGDPRTGRFKNSEVKRGESDSSDVSAYDLIMKDKERLLSFEEPVRFIFSHSALKEGWDNPNVFQICTLRQSQGEIKKRQEIGRGLRLCVNKNGERQDAEALGTHSVHDINVLTVIANESYETFAQALQDEFAEVIRNRPKEITPDLFSGKTIIAGEQEHTISSSEASRIFVGLETSEIVKEGQLTPAFIGLSPEKQQEKLTEALGRIDEKYQKFAEPIKKLMETVYNPQLKPMVSNERSKSTLHLDREKFASKTFKEMWAKINAKTFYTVSFSDDKLIENCIRSLNKNLVVTKTQITITEGYLRDSGQENNLEMKKLKGKTVILQEIAAKNVKYDLIAELALPTRLTRKTICSILSGIYPQVFEQFKANPEEFIRKAIRLINEQKASTIIEHITYSLTNEKWTAEEIFVDASISGEYGKNVVDARKHIYDRLRFDSAVERDLAAEMDIQEKIEMYVKLPSGFFIHTPMGKYNPDWAIALKEGELKHIYFVAETKGTDSDLQLREVERAKIACARKHFERISSGEVKYDVVDSFETLLGKIRS
jgi:type III restriction enzyme